MHLNCWQFAKSLRSARACLAPALIALAFLFANNPAKAQDPDELARLNRQIAELKAQGETEQATALAERYVELARKAHGADHPEYATAITWLAWLYQSQERYADAEPLLEQALSIREAAFGPDHALVATSLNNLAGLYRKQGRDADADRLVARSDAIRAAAVGLNTLEAMPHRILELQRDGKTGEAADLTKIYVALAEKRYGADQPAVVPALLEAASIYLSLDRTDEAETLFKQVLAIREAAFGADSLEAAESLQSLADLYQAAGRYHEAEPLLERAMTIRERALGKRHEQVIDTMYALASLYRSQGRVDEAEKLTQAAEQIRGRAKRRLAFSVDEPTYAVVKVFYATDRENTGADDPAQVYGGDRGPLTFGTATVSIPRDHRMGEVETPSIWRLEWCNDPERFVVLLSVDETDEAKFFEDVSARVKKSAGKSAFVFVHGYNVTFTDAARRTAQMTYDLGFDGAPVFYSWPSQASYAAYKVDETNAEWSRLDFKTFLKAFATQSQADNIYLIAHSMGTRVLTGALKELFLEEPDLREKFDEIILAAPDIDADTFKRDIAPKILTGEGGTTLYASSGDYALIASKTFAGYPRAGDTASGITIVPGVDTIDASSIATDFVGHSYYADSGSVLGDLRDLILHRKRADKRSRLQARTAEGGKYWTFAVEGANGQ